MKPDLTGLQKILGILPQWLESTDGWSSLIINRRKPYTYRVFRQYEDCRVCLHEFDPCDMREAFFHPHPWPGSFYIADGCYKMKIGHAHDRFSIPTTTTTIVLPKHSAYEILDPLTFHSVIPVEQTLTVMINGQPWEKEIAHPEVRTTKGKDLDEMTDHQLELHLAKFRNLDLRMKL